MDKTVTVDTEAGPVVVRKLALYDYADLLRSFNQLPEKFGEFVQTNKAEDLKDNSFLFATVPSLIADALPEFAQMLSTVTDKDAEFHGRQLDLADNLSILAAALQLNDYQKVVGAIKKMMAQEQMPIEAETVEPNQPAES